MTEANISAFTADQPHDFRMLGIEEPILDMLDTLDYREPTSIQAQAIPKIIAGMDVIGMAATGTGKTATYLLPLIQKYGKKPFAHAKEPSVLVLVPTRELASQVADSLGKYSPSMKQRVALLYGGQAYGPQLDALKKGVTFVVGTPGRILDHLQRGSLKLNQVSAWVLDEADEMLDMGFASDIEEVSKTLPKKRQTLFFSATMPVHVAKMAQQFLSDPVTIKVARPEVHESHLPQVRQGVFHVDRTQKVMALTRLLDMEEPGAALVFCRTREEVDLLSHALKSRHAEALHGGLSQQQREKILARLRSRSTSLVVATDVAARGLDIPHLTHVINFDFPSTAEAYVHRVGRVGRAGRAGTALSFADSRHFYLVRQIEKNIKQKIKTEKIPTREQILKARLTRVKEQIKQSFETLGDLSALEGMLAELKDEKQVSSEQVSAAILAMYLGFKKEDLNREEFPQPERKGEDKKSNRRESSGQRFSGGFRGSRPQQGGHQAPRSRFKDKQRFGKKSKANP